MNFGRFLLITGTLGIVGGFIYWFIDFTIVTPKKEVDSALVHDTPDSLTPPVSREETVREVAKYFERTHGQIAPDQGPITNGTPVEFVSSEQDQFVQELENSINSSPEFRESLSRMDSPTQDRLLMEVDQRLARANPEDTFERLKLMKTAKEIDSIRSSPTASQIFLSEANRYFSSEKPEERDYAKYAFQYYLESEPDLQARERKHQEFLMHHQDRVQRDLASHPEDHH